MSDDLMRHVKESSAYDRYTEVNRMKRTIGVLLAILILIPCFAGCRDLPAAVDTSSVGDKDVFDLFMNAIKTDQLVEAYSFVSSAIATENTSSAEVKQSDHTLSLKAFTDRYNSFINTLRVESIEYEKTGEQTTGTSSFKVSYRITYNCADAGSLSYDCVMPVVVEGDVWRVVWSPSMMMPDLGWDESVGRAVLSAKRGDILTKDGTVVAKTINLITVYAVFSELVDYEVIAKRIADNEGITEKEASEKISSYLAKNDKLHQYCGDELQSLYDEISLYIKFDEEETPDKIFKSVVSDFMTIYQFRPEEVDTETLQALESIEGVHIDTKNYGSSREYPYGGFLAHNLGYVGAPTEEEVAALNAGRTESDGLYTTDSLIGKSGIERRYETELRGKDGYYYYIRNKDGSVKQVLFKHDKQDGMDVRLTIDFDLQQKTEKMLDIVLFGEDTSGAVIVMNPKTGEVEVAASYPTYDLNKFVVGFSGEEYHSLSEQPNKPFLDRTKRGLYPPGSTFKVFTAAAALDTGSMNANYVFTGRIEDDYWTPTGYGAWVWPRIKRTRVLNRTSPMNMENSMLHSDNIYFANAALIIGAEKFMTYLNDFGMDKPLPFELSTARSQVITNPANMNYKMLADTGYGQGEVLVTPLQLATMYCAFCNNGDLPTPRIFSGFYVTDGVDYKCVESSEYEVWIENAVSQNTINTIIPMLQGVVDPTKNGTGRSLRVTNVEVAGKTGSAEIGANKERIISWFAGFRLNVGLEDERVVIVMLDVPDNSRYTSLKFQIARELLKFDDTPDPNAAPES